MNLKKFKRFSTLQIHSTYSLSLCHWDISRAIRCKEEWSLSLLEWNMYVMWTDNSSNNKNLMWIILIVCLLNWIMRGYLVQALQFAFNYRHKTHYCLNTIERCRGKRIEFSAIFHIPRQQIWSGLNKQQKQTNHTRERKHKHIHTY